MSIHGTAIIETGAELGKNVTVGPYAFIGAKVNIGDGTRIDHHASIIGRTTVGQNNHIHSFATLGSQPQDLKYRGEDTQLLIGNENMIREYCNISLGTVTGANKTVIGNKNLFMVFSHIAHDCIIGDETIIANGVALAGHVTLGNKAVLGGLSAVHQFCRIGQLAMIAGGAMVSQDVAPFCTVQGDRAKPAGLNLLGLKRFGATTKDVTSLKEIYRLFFQENLTVENAREQILNSQLPSFYREEFLDFVQKSERGLCR